MEIIDWIIVAIVMSMWALINFFGVALVAGSNPSAQSHAYEPLCLAQKEVMPNSLWW